MTELRAVDAGLDSSRLLFALLCLSWSLISVPFYVLLALTYRLRLGHRFDPPQDPEAFRLELERYYRNELTHECPAARSASSSCR
jgi:hypothetical protein